jgi:hypothetical protein
MGTWVRNTWLELSGRAPIPPVQLSQPRAASWPAQGGFIRACAAGAPGASRGSLHHSLQLPVAKSVVCAEQAGNVPWPACWARALTPLPQWCTTAGRVAAGQQGFKFRAQLRRRLEACRRADVGLERAVQRAGDVPGHRVQRLDLAAKARRARASIRVWRRLLQAGQHRLPWWPVCAAGAQAEVGLEVRARPWPRRRRRLARPAARRRARPPRRGRPT